ncbi:MAG TPA: M28 family metallopeptidase [Longimicrobiales bacterium]|nr:M28 family metallopeptidase [Longimicrobiales bacterium]
MTRTPVRFAVAVAVAAIAPLLAAASAARAQAVDPQTIPSTYRQVADRLIDAAVANQHAYERLGELVDRFGPRLSGSQSLEKAMDWARAQMEQDGLENVRSEPVMVPHWVRGEESAALVQPWRKDLAMMGLGGSVGTPAGGITAPVYVVSSFDDLKAHAADAKGKIVLFDAPFVSYGRTVAYRVNGAIEAAKAGAVASLIRSVASYSIYSPHTGVMRYDSAVRKIPHAAITVEDAEMLHRMQDRGQPVVVHLEMGAKTLPDAQSQNVMAEVTGREKPDEVVIISGHMDSWDVGQGAMDDGGGAVAAWEAVRLMHDLGLRPRRTVRVVLWTNEENGTRGGEAYARDHAAQLDKHVLAIESDGGVFKPQGFGFSGPDGAMPIVQQVGKLLDRIGAGSVTRGGGGEDISPMMHEGVPGMGLQVDGERYFWFHHSNGDTLDKLDPGQMAECVATLAVMAYVVADLPEPLPHGGSSR